jgi:hypothetical protein
MLLPREVTRTRASGFVVNVMPVFMFDFEEQDWDSEALRDNSWAFPYVLEVVLNKT